MSARVARIAIPNQGSLRGARPAHTAMAAFPDPWRSTFFDLSQIPGGKLHYLRRKDQSCIANQLGMLIGDYPTHREFDRFECLNCNLVINHSAVKLTGDESPNG